VVAYSFKPQFERPIQERIKPHTLRDVGRRRHAHPGEAVQLYIGMRTRACRMIGRAQCDRLQRVSLEFGSSVPIIIWDAVRADTGIYEAVGDGRPIEAPEAFAISDGFESLDAMARFWRDTHGVSEWQGLLIGWDVTTLVLPEAA
jgi:hypothetical protein